MLQSTRQLTSCKNVKSKLQLTKTLENIKMQLKVDRKKYTFILNLKLKGGTSNEVWREFI